MALTNFENHGNIVGMSIAPLFQAENENAIPELVELSFDAGQGSNPKSIIVLADLIFGQARQYLTHQTVEYNTTYAELSLETSCTNFTESTRFGNTTLPNEVDVSRTKTGAQERQLESGADISLGPNPALNVKGGKKNSAREDTGSSYLLKETRVRAKGNSKWDISEPEKDRPLLGRYIGSSPLCLIESNSDINSVSLSVLVPKKHFNIVSITDNISGDEKKIMRARRRVLEALSRRSYKNIGDSLLVSKGLITRGK